MIPKVKFRIESFDEAFETIILFLSPKSGWHKKIFGQYPELEKKLDGKKTWEEVEIISKEFFRSFYEKNLKKIKERAQKYKSLWERNNDGFMLALEEVLEIKWPSKIKVFTCRIGISPVCPRYLDKNMFDVSAFFSDNEFNEVVCHELLHFLYFEKWKEIFPNYNRKNFESPHLVWHLSEIVPKIILNDKKIQKVIKLNPRVYDSYEKLVINNRPLLSWIQEIYDNKKDFADFLIRACNFVKKHKEMKKLK